MFGQSPNFLSFLGQSNPAGQYGPNTKQVPDDANPYGNFVTPVMPDFIRQNFLSPNLMAPFYNQAAVAGNLGTMQGQVAPYAANFMQQQFSPFLNGFENAFLSAGAGNSMMALEQMMNKQQDQFENTPFHSSLPRAQGEAAQQAIQNMTQQAAQLGLQRQQSAAQMSQFPFNFGLQASNTAPTDVERMFNLANQAYASYTQMPLQAFSQFPVASPVVVQPGGGASK